MAMAPSLDRPARTRREVTGHLGTAKRQGEAGLLAFHLRQPMEGERPCWQRWRDLAGVCERNLTAARINHEQEQHDDGNDDD
jgi:hypothetical protein